MWEHTRGGGGAMGEEMERLGCQTAYIRQKSLKRKKKKK
jgi:hypothetical protein